MKRVGFWFVIGLWLVAASVFEWFVCPHCGYWHDQRERCPSETV